MKSIYETALHNLWHYFKRNPKRVSTLWKLKYGRKNNVLYFILFFFCGGGLKAQNFYLYDVWNCKFINVIIILLVARKNLWRNPRKLRRRRATESFWTGKLSTFRGNSQRDFAHGMHTSCRFSSQNSSRYRVSILLFNSKHILLFYYMLWIIK